MVLALNSIWNDGQSPRVRACVMTALTSSPLRAGGLSVRVENHRDRFTQDIPPSKSGTYIGARWLDKGKGRTVLTITDPGSVAGDDRAGPASSPLGRRTAVVSFEDINWHLVLKGDVAGGQSCRFTLCRQPSSQSGWRRALARFVQARAPLHVSRNRDAWARREQALYSAGAPLGHPLTTVPAPVSRFTFCGRGRQQGLRRRRAQGRQARHPLSGRQLQQRPHRGDHRASSTLVVSLLCSTARLALLTRIALCLSLGLVETPRSPSRGRATHVPLNPSRPPRTATPIFHLPQLRIRWRLSPRFRPISLPCLTSCAPTSVSSSSASSS